MYDQPTKDALQRLVNMIAAGEITIEEIRLLRLWPLCPSCGRQLNRVQGEPLQCAACGWSQEDQL